MSKIIILSGPSGIGKNTVLNLIMNKFPKLENLLSMTTRKKRDNEIDGIDYIFVSKKEFEKYIEANCFFEYVEFASNYYGVLNKEILNKLDNGINIITIMEFEGTFNAKSKLDNVLTIFLMPPNLDELKKRLLNRNDNNVHEVNKRLNIALTEIENSKYYDHVIVNNELKNTVNQLEVIISNYLQDL